MDEDDEHDGKPKSKPKAKTTAQQLVDIARAHYTFGRSTNGENFAIHGEDPGVVRMLRGGSHSIKAELSQGLYALTGKVASAGALGDAMNVIAGLCQREEPQDLFIRVAPLANGGVLIDRGCADCGEFYEVTPEGWSIRQHQKGDPLFRRTELTGDLPRPRSGGSLRCIRPFVRASDEDWPVIVGWLAAALIPDIPHPILDLGGEEGSGKTYAATALMSLIDPSTVAIGSRPKNEEAWLLRAYSSWAVGIDNLSNIPDWLSDTLCRTVTGDGQAVRMLYTDGELVVRAFRRVIIFTAIAMGIIRSDLASRMLQAEFTPIPKGERKPEKALDAELEAMLPFAMGALLDVLSKVLKHLPEASEMERDCPRMADFGEVLTAMDLAFGTKSFERFVEMNRELAADVIQGDCVAVALLAHLSVYPDGVTKKPSDLLADLKAEMSLPLPADWPGNAKVLSERIKRAAPGLRKEGWTYTKGKGGDRLLTFTPLSMEADDDEED